MVQSGSLLCTVAHCRHAGSSGGKTKKQSSEPLGKMYKRNLCKIKLQASRDKQLLGILNAIKRHTSYYCMSPWLKHRGFRQAKRIRQSSKQKTFKDCRCQNGQRFSCGIWAAKSIQNWILYNVRGWGVHAVLLPVR